MKSAYWIKPNNQIKKNRNYSNKDKQHKTNMNDISQFKSLFESSKFK